MNNVTHYMLEVVFQLCISLNDNTGQMGCPPFWSELKYNNSDLTNCDKILWSLKELYSDFTVILCFFIESED